MASEVMSIRWFKSDIPEEKSAYYTSILPIVKEAARKCGYAIGVHGSLRRDMDLIAVPWVERCTTPDKLSEEIQLAVVGAKSLTPPPVIYKPHGRLGYRLHVGVYAYIDMSVIPPDSYDKD